MQSRSTNVKDDVAPSGSASADVLGRKKSASTDKTPPMVADGYISDPLRVAARCSVRLTQTGIALMTVDYLKAVEAGPRGRHEAKQYLDALLIAGVNTVLLNLRVDKGVRGL